MAKGEQTQAKKVSARRSRYKRMANARRILTPPQQDVDMSKNIDASRK